MQPRIEDLLIAALNFEGDASLYLDSLCKDHEIKREVLSLYDAARNADGFLSQSPVHNMVGITSLNMDLSGERLGAYKLVKKIGEGGMGTVYLAERADGQYRQKVAIKLLSHRMSDNAVQQFRLERQLLANMNHPNIARILDGGDYLEGLPYLVMELVEGEPIDAYCRNHKLSLCEMLNLFEQVCDAVQYAHSQGVIHRDLKPSNLYVTNQGQVKLLDFGIAKPAAQELTDIVAPFTPAYAAPEQINGGTVNSATDVYSLGIILQEMLTGHRPVNNNISTTSRMRLALDMGSRRNSIERIILKALQKDSTKRFSSVYDLRCAVKICRKSLYLPSMFGFKTTTGQYILIVLALLSISLTIFIDDLFLNIARNRVQTEPTLATTLCIKNQPNH